MTQVESYSSRRARRIADPGSTGADPTRLPAPTRPPAPAGSYEPAGHQRRPLPPPQNSRDPRAPEPELPAEGRRGSHATTYGQGFSWVLTWTIVGSLIPGAGLIAAGRRIAGGILLGLLGLAGLTLAVLALFGNPVREAISLAVDPQMLFLIALGCGVVALVWAAVIILTNQQLRQSADLSTGQRAFSRIVVLALIVGVALPAYKIGDTALIQRSLINAVFTDAGDAEAGQVNTGPKAEKADPWADKPRVNVLLIGSDAGKGRIGVRPDTMIVASIDTKTGDAVLFSLPRNLERAPFAAGSPGAAAWPNGYDCGDECLLNAIWTWALDAPGYQKYKNPGLQATKDAVQGVTGLKIDTYAMLNLKGFAQFVNAIGGLRVNVDERLPIGGNSEHPEQTSGYIEKGRNQKLDGYETLWYARSRWSTNDFDRMRRQRCVIGAVVNQSDPIKLARAFPAIAKAAKDNISTGIPQRDLQAWVELSQRVKNGSVRSLPFTDEVISNRANPDFDEIQRLVRKALRPVVKATPTPAPSTGASPAPTKKPTKKPTKAAIDPLKAQDVNAVC